MDWFTLIFDLDRRRGESEFRKSEVLHNPIHNRPSGSIAGVPICNIVLIAGDRSSSYFRSETKENMESGFWKLDYEVLDPFPISGNDVLQPIPSNFGVVVGDMRGWIVDFGDEGAAC